MRADVVVIGAGLAGLQCARLLSRRGIAVTIIDRKQVLGERIHTTGIFVRKTLEDFDIPADCLGPVVRTVRLVSPRGRAMTLRSPHDEFRVGAMGRLYERMLAECIASGASYLSGTRYISSEPSTAGTLARFERDGDEFAIEARLIIGADGATSRVARDLGLDENSRWLVGVEDVLEGSAGDGEPRFDCHLDPVIAPGYLAWVVSDGHGVHVGVGGYPGRFNAAEALERFYERLDPALGRRPRLERRGGLIPVGGMLRRIACPRGLLVGDASGAVSPLTAGGLDPAMRLSVLAADVAAEMLAGNTAAHHRYSGDRFAARFISRRWMRSMLGAVRSPWMMEVGCAALRTWPCSRLAEHVFFGRGSFPDVAEMERLPGRPAGAVAR